ncbi:MAG: hypothetical protein LBS19_16355 [Clostridiales bacterium]|jgi:hypothetical protein|nr:hypothetical protein [Clostridiales bacterium]
MRKLIPGLLITALLTAVISSCGNPAKTAEPPKNLPSSPPSYEDYIGTHCCQLNQITKRRSVWIERISYFWEFF